MTNIQDLKHPITRQLPKTSGRLTIGKQLSYKPVESREKNPGGQVSCCHYNGSLSMASRRIVSG